MVKEYIKKPIKVQAIQFFRNKEIVSEISKFMGKEVEVRYRDYNEPVLFIDTLEGLEVASEGDFIIKGIKGEFYPCKPDVFEKTYAPIEIN